MSELKVNKVSPVTGTQLTLGDSGDTIDLSTTTVTLPANSVDSDQYVDASIDNAHLADDAVNSDELAAGAVDLAHMSATGTPSSSNFLRGDNSWQAAGGGAWTFINTAVADDDPSLTVTGLDTSLYGTHVIRIENLYCMSQGTSLWVRLGDSGGINSSANAYSWMQYVQTASSHTPSYNGGNGAHTAMILDTFTGPTIARRLSATCWLGASTVAQGICLPTMTSEAAYIGQNGVLRGQRGFGGLESTMNVTQVQILMSSGNLGQGRLTVYGIKHS